MLGLALSLLVAAPVLAQDAGPVTFEAASVRPNRSGTPGMEIRITPNGGFCVSVSLWFVLAHGASPVAQDAPARFDAASVKPNRSGSGKSSANSTRAQLVATNVPLMWLVRDAYQLQEHQVLGLPGWAASDRYDVMAKADIEKPAPGVYRQMLKNLLADRFGLAAHTETREGTIYHLVVAREGRLGPKMTPTTVTDCVSANGTDRPCGTGPAT
jgi:hypothetical protein